MEVSIGTTPVLRSGNATAENRAAIDMASYQRVQPALSVVVPTRNEAENIKPLVVRLEQALSGISLEIIFVDDSDDGTVAAIEALQTQTSSRIELIHRQPDQRTNGLSGAVVEGLRAAEAPWVCVMD